MNLSQVLPLYCLPEVNNIAAWKNPGLKLSIAIVSN